MRSRASLNRLDRGPRPDVELRHRARGTVHFRENRLASDREDAAQGVVGLADKTRVVHVQGQRARRSTEERAEDGRSGGSPSREFFADVAAREDRQVLRARHEETEASETSPHIDPAVSDIDGGTRGVAEADQLVRKLSVLHAQSARGFLGGTGEEDRARPKRFAARQSNRPFAGRRQRVDARHAGPRSYAPLREAREERLDDPRQTAFHGDEPSPSRPVAERPR